MKLKIAFSIADSGSVRLVKWNVIQSVLISKSLAIVHYSYLRQERIIKEIIAATMEMLLSASSKYP